MPNLLLPALPASQTYRVPSDSSCLVIQLLSPFSVVRTFICLEDSIALFLAEVGRGFPGGGKARTGASAGGAHPRALRPASCSPPLQLPAWLLQGQVQAQEVLRPSPLLLPPRAEMFMASTL